jgi:hypothetical protein
MATKKSGSSKKAAKKKAATKEPSAAQLKGLQTRLNDDTRFRNQFFKDPGSVLRREGVELGAAKEQQLAKYIHDVTSGPMEVFGAEITKVKATDVRIRTVIRIGLSIRVGL